MVRGLDKNMNTDRDLPIDSHRDWDPREIYAAGSDSPQKFGQGTIIPRRNLFREIWCRNLIRGI